VRGSSPHGDLKHGAETPKGACSSQYPRYERYCELFLPDAQQRRAGMTAASTSKVIDALTNYLNEQTVTSGVVCGSTSIALARCDVV